MLDEASDNTKNTVSHKQPSNYHFLGMLRIACWAYICASTLNVHVVAIFGSNYKKKIMKMMMIIGDCH